MPDVSEEAGRYDSGMGRIMDGMNDAMGSMMSHCSGSGMDEMHSSMSGMQAKMRAHVDVLETTTDVGFARALCESHVSEMRGMLSNMQHALGRTGCKMMGF